MSKHLVRAIRLVALAMVALNDLAGIVTGLVVLVFDRRRFLCGATGLASSQAARS